MSFGIVVWIIITYGIGCMLAFDCVDLARKNSLARVFLWPLVLTFCGPIWLVKGLWFVVRFLYDEVVTAIKN